MPVIEPSYKSGYCRRCDGYSAEVGKPNDAGLCPHCAEIERLRAVLDDIAYADELQDARAKARAALDNA